MAKYDHGGGCACGLYKECQPGCNNYQPPQHKPDCKTQCKDQALHKHACTCGVERIFSIDQALLEMAAARITELAQNARSVIFDRPKPLDCRILKGKYKGRLARVDGVIACERRGLLYLAYVYKLVLKKGEYVPSKEYLNSDGESRQYRPLEEIEILWA